MPGDDDVYFLTCDICGAEEDEEIAEESWVSFAKMDVFEVLVCTECAGSVEKLEQALAIFVVELEAARREAMT